MAEKPTSPDTSLQIRWTFAALRQKVFEAWTEAEKLNRWLCRVTEQHSTKLLELDVRAGGSHRLEVTTPEGNRMLLSGTYRELKSPGKLVFTWQWEGDPDFGETFTERSAGFYLIAEGVCRKYEKSYQTNSGNNSRWPQLHSHTSVTVPVLCPLSRIMPPFRCFLIKR